MSIIKLKGGTGGPPPSLVDREVAIDLTNKRFYFGNSGVQELDYSLTGHDHDSEYSPLGHTHTLNDLSNVTVPSPSNNQFLMYSGGVWGPQTPGISHVSGLQSALDGKEPVFTKNSAFNKNFGGNGSATTVARSDHDHDLDYLPLTGGTLTGGLTLGGDLNLAGNDLIFSNAGGPLAITQTDSYTLTLTGDHQSNTIVLQPAASTGYELGASANPWEKIYGGAIYEGGTLLSSKYLGISDNAVSASKWLTAKTFTVTLTGDVTGTANHSIDGSASKTFVITATVADDSHNHIISNVDGLQTALDGKHPLGGSSTQDFAARNMTVHGTLLTKNAQEVDIGDAIIVLNAEETGTPSEDAGLDVERGTATNVWLRWNESDDRWEMRSSAGFKLESLGGLEKMSVDGNGNLSLAGAIDGGTY